MPNKMVDTLITVPVVGDQAMFTEKSEPHAQKLRSIAGKANAYPSVFQDTQRKYFARRFEDRAGVIRVLVMFSSIDYGG